MSQEIMNSRTHEWADPRQIAEEIRDMSGEEFFSAWQDGQVVPPMAATLGFRLAAFDEGRVEITCDPAEFHYNPSGMVHGGLAATLLDTATGCAIHTLLPAGVGYATLDLHVTYLRPVTTQTGPLTCVGTVTSHGRRVAVAEAELLGEDRRVAQATSTCLILDSR